MKRTKIEIKITWRGYDLVIPKGTRTTNKTALGKDEKDNFVDDLSWIDRKKFPLLYHDATYYGINIQPELLEEY